MRPGRYDIKIKRGGTYSIGLTGNVNGTAINFTQRYTGARLHVRPAWVGSQEDILGSPLYVMSTTGGEIVFAETIMTIQLTAEATKMLPFSNASYDLELYSAGTIEVVDPFLYGLIDVGFERAI